MCVALTTMMTEIYECVNFQKTSNVSEVGPLFDVVVTTSVFGPYQIFILLVLVPVKE